MVLLDLLGINKTFTAFPVLNQACHIAPHLLNLADQSSEVLHHRVQEIGQRGLNLFHFLLDADDTLLELLADIGRARVVLAFGHEDVLGLNVAHFFRLQLDVVVSTALVYNLDMAHFVAHNLVLDRRLVAMLRLSFDLLVDKRVFGENFTHEELFGQGEGLHILLGNVDEFGFGV